MATPRPKSQLNIAFGVLFIIGAVLIPVIHEILAAAGLPSWVYWLYPIGVALTSVLYVAWQRRHKRSTLTIKDLEYTIAVVGPSVAFVVALIGIIYIIIFPKTPIESPLREQTLQNIDIISHSKHINGEQISICTKLRDKGNALTASDVEDGLIDFFRPWVNSNTMPPVKLGTIDEFRVLLYVRLITNNGLPDQERNALTFLLENFSPTSQASQKMVDENLTAEAQTILAGQEYATATELMRVQPTATAVASQLAASNIMLATQASLNQRISGSATQSEMTRVIAVSELHWVTVTAHAQNNVQITQQAQRDLTETKLSQVINQATESANQINANATSQALQVTDSQNNQATLTALADMRATEQQQRDATATDIEQMIRTATLGAQEQGFIQATLTMAANTFATQTAIVNATQIADREIEAHCYVTPLQDLASVAVHIGPSRLSPNYEPRPYLYQADRQYRYRVLAYHSSSGLDIRDDDLWWLVEIMRKSDGQPDFAWVSNSAVELIHPEGCGTVPPY